MTILRRFLTGAAVLAVVSGVASADMIASISGVATFNTDGTYSLTLADLNTSSLPVGAVVTGATLYFFGSESLNNLTLTNTAATTQAFDIAIGSNLLLGSANSANNADRFTGETLDLFDTGIGTGQASLPSPEGTITLGGTGLPACPEFTPSSSCNSVAYTPPTDVVNNTDAVYGFTTGTGLLGLDGVIKNITAADLAANYEGSGTFTLSGGTKSLTTLSGGGANIAFGVNDTASFQAEIDYDYIIPSGTPEPATMALMGSALLGLGLLGKRIRK